MNGSELEDNCPGRLHMVATPIGNLDDITHRAVRVLGDVDLIAAEDTRKTRILLKRYGIKTPLTSFNARNGARKVPGLIDFMSKGKDLALVSEAGTPGVSDPGARLTREALKQRLAVVSIPGPSSVTAALSVSGLPGGAFHFLGFLPKKAGKRRRLLETAAGLNTTVVLFVPARSLVDTLEEILTLFADRQVVVCREMTKLHEEARCGTLSEIIEHYKAVPPRGEVTLVVSPP